MARSRIFVCDGWCGWSVQIIFGYHEMAFQNKSKTTKCHFDIPSTTWWHWGGSSEAEGGKKGEEGEGQSPLRANSGESGGSGAGGIIREIPQGPPPGEPAGVARLGCPVGGLSRLLGWAFFWRKAVGEWQLPRDGMSRRGTARPAVQ